MEFVVYLIGKYKSDNSWLVDKLSVINKENIELTNKIEKF